MITLIGTPQSKDTFFYNFDIILQGSNVESQSSNLLAFTCCATRYGSVFIAYEDVSNDHTVLREIDLNTQSVINEFTINHLIGERAGKHCLHSLPNKNLLTVNRSTHDVVIINHTTGALITTLSLNINPFDGWVNNAGTVLSYVSGNLLKRWDIPGDAALSDIKNFGFPIIWPIWESDDTVTVFTGTYNNVAADFLRVNLSGTLIKTYTGYTNGVRGYAISIANNKFYAYVSEDSNPVSMRMVEFNYTSGAYLTKIWLNSISSTFPYIDVASGFIGIYENSISSVTINCSTMNVTITGTSFPTTPTIKVLQGGVTFTDYTVVSHNATTIVLHFNSFSNATYGFAVL